MLVRSTKLQELCQPLESFKNEISIINKNQNKNKNENENNK